MDLTGDLEMGVNEGSWAAGGGDADLTGIGGSEVDVLQRSTYENRIFQKVGFFTHLSPGLKRLLTATCKSIAASIFLFELCYRTLSSHTPITDNQSPYAPEASEFRPLPSLPDHQLHLVQEMKPYNHYQTQGHEWPQRQGCQHGSADRLVQEFWDNQLEVQLEPPPQHEHSETGWKGEPSWREMGGRSWHEKVG